MIPIDVDRMVELDEAETAARDRFYAARERGDIEALRKAAKEWTNAAKAATDYALGKVEPYTDG